MVYDAVHEASSSDVEGGARQAKFPWLAGRSSSKRGLEVAGICLIVFGVFVVLLGLVNMASSTRTDSLQQMTPEAPGTNAYEDVMADGEWQERQEQAQRAPYEDVTLDECTPYMKDQGCAWTRQWNCPGQEGGEGMARVDGTTGYNCCCQKGLWKHLPEEPKNEYWTSGYHKILKLYHQTSPEVCESIMASNFKLGKGGLCGKAIYFALSPEATSGKAITQWSHGGCMIEAEVDVGKQAGYYWSGGPDRRFGRSCGGWNAMTGPKLHKTGADSIVMRQADGDEIVIFESERIVAKRILPFKCHWMCRGRCQKHWPSNCRHR